MKRIPLSAIIIIICLLSGCAIPLQQISTTTHNPPKSDEYNRIIAGKEDYFLVANDVETYDDVYTELGVVDVNGNWIQPLSRGHIFSTSQNDGELQINSKNCFYLNEAMFLLITSENSYRAEGVMYNAIEDISFDTGEFGGMATTPLASRIPDFSYNEGYCITSTDNHYDSKLKILDTKGHVNDTDIDVFSPFVGDYSEGVFYGSQGIFYDIDLKKIIDLSEYNIVNIPKFENSKCTIIIKNSNDTKYKTEIDHEGNFLYEPQPYESETK